MFTKAFERRATKGQQFHPKDPALANWFGGSESASGKQVTVESAMALSAVFSCIDLLSSTIAMLPLYLYKKEGDRNILQEDEPLFRILHIMPNKWQTGFEFWRLIIGNYLGHGNAYALIVRGNGGEVQELIPLDPRKMVVFIAPDGLPAYQYTYQDGKEAVYLYDEIMHIKDYAPNGYVGESRILKCQDSLGLYMAAEEFGSKFFANGTTLAGVLEHPQTMSDKAYSRLRKSWSDRHAGSENAYKPAILEEGMKWTSISINPGESQLLETRKFQVVEVCRIYQVPPHMIQSLENATYSNIEEQGINFTTYSLMPHTYNIEQVIFKDVFTEMQRKNHFARFKVKELTRGNASARAAMYKERFYTGSISSNEIRKEEGDNPVDGGDTYYIPVNMAEVGNLPTQNEGNANEG